MTPQDTDWTPPLVLVIENDWDTAETTALLLSAWGFAPVIASDGTSGLQLAAECPPAAVVLDLQLPDLDGCEVARRLLAAGSADAPRLIAVTGLTRPADRKRAAAAGITANLVKPVNPDELQRSL